MKVQSNFSIYYHMVNLFFGLIMLGIMGHTQLHTQQRHQEVCGLAKMLLHG